MFLAPDEASMTFRAKNSHKIDDRKPLGCRNFQREIRKGVHTSCTTPDGSCVAILTQDFSILIYDTLLGKTFRVKPIE